jgi:hypothetical protein
MQVTSFYRAGLIVLLVGGIVPTPARALLTFDQGHDQLFATGTAGLEYDSNVEANSSGHGDTIFTGGAGLEYTRHAGVIAADATAGLSFSRFDKLTADDFSDPHFQGELSAKDDRAAADLTLAAARESAPDIVSGTRAVSWNDSAGLNVKYQVTERYSVAGNFNYTLQDFQNTPQLSNIRDYNAGANLYYSINSARDFFTGYTYSFQETSNGLSYDNHSFSVGIDGKLLPKLNGTASVGYELQVPHGSNDHSTGSLTDAVALTWNFSRRLKFTGDVSQNFGATSIGVSVNTLAASLDAVFAMNAKTSFHAGVGGGNNRFIGAAAGGRRDTYFTWTAGASYVINDHFTINADYAYFENWSTLSLSDFIRHTINLTLNIRY